MRSFAILLLSLVAVGCEKDSSVFVPEKAVLNQPSAPTETAGQPQVELQFLDFDGIQKLIESKRGKVVVMDAWSTSCPPCVKEFPHLVELHKKYGDQLACISLSFDYEGIGKPEEAAPRVLEFLTKQQATFDNVLSSEESDALYRKFKLSAVPAVFVYDRDGKFVKRFDNENAKTEADGFTYAQVEELVQELIKE